MKNLMLLGAAVTTLFAAEAQAGQSKLGIQAKVKLGNVTLGFSSPAPAFKTCTPVIHYPVQKKHWVSGHYEVQIREVFVPGHYEQVWINPVYSHSEDFFGNCAIKFLVSPGHYETVWVEEGVKLQRCKVWIPGKWVHC